MNFGIWSKLLHRAGIEVILDVGFSITLLKAMKKGSQPCPFRGLGTNPTYYIFGNQMIPLLIPNYSGCGNYL